MRIPKFRAWLKKEQRMIDVFAMTFFEDDICNVSDYNYDFYTEDEFKLMQFTGLKDKKGKEVFEGDIIKDNGGFIAYIVYDKDYALFSLNYKPFNSVNGLSISFEELRNTYDYNFEVIGNIWKNKELLEEI